MSYHADDGSGVEQPLSKTVWITAIFLFLLSAGLGFFAYLGGGLLGKNEYTGLLSIEADPDTKIYLGDKLVGSTQVSLTFDELFDDEKYKGMMVELPYPEGVTPVLVSGSDAKLLFSRPLGGGSLTDVDESGRANTVINRSGDEYLIRRADGALDHVFAAIIDWTPPGQARRHFLLPLRVRKGLGPTTIYFHTDGSGTSSGPGMVRVYRKFTGGAPPGEFSEEIKTKGLWEPGYEK